VEIKVTSNLTERIRMSKLRLLVTDKCDRHCRGCCNLSWDLDRLPVVKSFEGYDEILLTGGEPMRSPLALAVLIGRIQQENPDAKIYVYTADVSKTELALDILWFADGMSVTLHETSDVNDWIEFDQAIRRLGWAKEKSLRLNVFKDVDMRGMKRPKDWKTRTNMTWIENCPLPKDEVFMRLT
jgi:hypothetical protein